MKEEQTKSAGKAKIGGPFTLVDQNGIPVTDAKYRGKFMAIYFGFTNCPDICPTELKRLGNVLKQLDTEETGIGKMVQPIFISIDPMRDTVAQVREYVSGTYLHPYQLIKTILEFHPRLVGLTGTPEQVEKVCRAYRVYFSKANAEEEDYLLDHSIIIYLMDPKGDFVEFYGSLVDEKQMLERMKNQLLKYAKSELGEDEEDIPVWKKFFGLK